MTRCIPSDAKEACSEEVGIIIDGFVDKFCIIVDSLVAIKTISLLINFAEHTQLLCLYSNSSMVFCVKSYTVCSLCCTINNFDESGENEQCLYFITSV